MAAAVVADRCSPQLGVCATRVATLNANGTVATGESIYVSAAILKATIKPNFEDGDEVSEKNGCGDVYVSFKGPDSLKWYDIELEFLSPDPYLLSLLVPASELITASAGARIGWAAPGTTDAVTAANVSVELWTKRVSGGGLSQVYPYAHHALPFVQNLRLGDRTLDSGAQHVVVTGQAIDNTNWFDGPGNDWPLDDGAAYKANAWKWIPEGALPTVQCGPITAAAS